MVLVPPTVTAVGLATSVDCDSEAVPAMKLTVVGLLACVSALPPRLAVIVAVPIVAGAVSVAVYVPSAWSVTDDSEPVPVLASVTVPPLVVSAVPLASRSCTVIVLVLVPFAVSDVGLALIVDCTSDAT